MIKSAQFKPVIVALFTMVFLLSSVRLISIVIERNKRIILETPIITSDYNDSALKPVRLELPAVGIYLPVTEAVLRGNTWEYSNDSVSFLSESPLPGKTGNSIFYGHNWPNLLKPLNKIKSGDLLTIHINNGDKRLFKVANIFIVTPDQTHVLNPTETPIVTIYTCAGFLDSKRLVVVFVPAETE